MIIKESVLDRLEQSIKLTFNNYKELILPVAIFQIAFGTLYSTILLAVTPNILGEGFFDNIKSVLIASGNQSPEMILSILSDSSFLFMIYFGITMALVIAILFIPIKILIIKGVSNIVRGNKNKTEENITYGFKNILNSFKVYWYIFEYVYLYPALILIFLLMGLLYTTFVPGLIIEIWPILLIVGLLFILAVLPFIIIRGIKATFALYAAIDGEDFSKDRFKKTLPLSIDNKLRIFGNLLLTGFVIGFASGIITGIINGIISIFQPSNNDLENTLYSIENGVSPEEALSDVNIQDIINVNIFDITKGIVTDITNAIGIAILTVFTFILYKRLVIEYNNLKGNNITEKKVVNEAIVEINATESKKEIEL